MIEFKALNGRRFFYRLSCITSVTDNAGDWWVSATDLASREEIKVSEETAAIIVEAMGLAL